MKPSIVRVLPRFGQPGRDELAGSSSARGWRVGGGAVELKVGVHFEWMKVFGPMSSGCRAISLKDGHAG